MPCSSPTPASNPCAHTHSAPNSRTPCSTHASSRSPKGGGGRESLSRPPALPHSRPWGCTPRPACLAANAEGEKGPGPPNSSDACCFLPRTPFPRCVRGDKESRGRTRRGSRAAPPPPPSRIARGAPEVRPTYVRPDAVGPLGWQNSFKKNFKKKRGDCVGRQR
jgi:hypothetical protein